MGQITQPTIGQQILRKGAPWAFLLLLIFMFLHLGSNSTVTADDEELNKRVNAHLQEVDRKMEMDHLQVEVTNAKLPPLHQINLIEQDSVSPLDLSQDVRPQKVHDSIRTATKEPDLRTAIEDDIGHQIKLDQFAANYNDVARVEFIKAVQERARAQGFEISVNKQGIVTSVHPLDRTPQGTSANQALSQNGAAR